MAINSLSEAVSLLLRLETRKEAYLYLRESLKNDANAKQELPILLWHSCGVITAILQDIIVYLPHWHPHDMTTDQFSQVCEAFNMLEVCAVHQETKLLFYKAQIHVYLLPFLSSDAPAVDKVVHTQILVLYVFTGLLKGTENTVFGAEIVDSLLLLDFPTFCINILPTNYSDMKRQSHRNLLVSIIEHLLGFPNGVAYVCQTERLVYHLCQAFQSYIQTADYTNMLLNRMLFCFNVLSKHHQGLETVTQAIAPIWRMLNFPGARHPDFILSKLKELEITCFGFPRLARGLMQ